jgi:copper chaperone CopZ
MSKNSVHYIVSSALDQRDVKQLKRRLDTLPGVLSVSVGGEENRIAVDYDNTGSSAQSIGDALRGMGYEIVMQRRERHTM